MKKTESRYLKTHITTKNPYDSIVVIKNYATFPLMLQKFTEFIIILVERFWDLCSQLNQNIDQISFNN